MMHNGLSEPLYRKCKADLTTHTIDLFKEIKQPQQGLDRAMLFRRCKKLKPGARANRVGGSLPGSRPLTPPYVRNRIRRFMIAMT